MIYSVLSKTGSLDNATREFSLLRHHALCHILLYKYDKRTRNFLAAFHYLYFSLVFYILCAFLIKTIVLLALIEYEMIIANSYTTRARGTTVN